MPELPAREPAARDPSPDPLLQVNAMSAPSSSPYPQEATATRRTPLQRFLLAFAASRLAVLGFVLLSAIIVLAVVAPWIAPQNPYDLMQLDIMDGQLPPGSVSATGMTYWLGTDDQGRDMLSGILYGLRISLLVGLTSALAAAAIGTTLGLVAAYAGGRTGTAIMRVVDLQLSFPTILVALMILAFLGKGVVNVILALIIVEWAAYARIARASAMVQRRKEYIEAAVCQGASSLRILFRHLLPNCLPPLMVIATVQIARAIALEATLSFLGLGVPITEPSLGLLISNGYQHMLSGKFWISFYPGVALLITVVAINLIGDHLRDVLNPRSDS
jgi:peptide/nickel transport system permease protein